jgi:hypothetical protein
MFGSGTLDTVIGLVFVFLLVSMLVTIANEIIAAAFSSRAFWLRYGIERLLGSAWAQKMYEHPLVKNTTKSGDIGKKGRGGPSYIPSRTFANLLLEFVQQNSQSMAQCRESFEAVLQAGAAGDATVESLKAQLAAIAPELRQLGPLGTAAVLDLTRRLEAPAGPATHQWLNDLELRITQLSALQRPQFTPLLATLTTLVDDGRNAAVGIDDLRARFDQAVNGLVAGPATLALAEELRALGQRLRGPYTVADAQADILWFIDGMSSRYLRQMIAEVPEENIRKLLLTLFDDAKHDVDKFKENIEAWFNNGMDRVNGWYKRKSQWVLGGLGLGIAVLMNVDTVLIFRHLQSNPVAREALVGQAMAFTQANQGLPRADPKPGETTVISGEKFQGTITIPALDTKQDVLIETEHPAVRVLTPNVEAGPKATQVTFQAATEFTDAQSKAVITAKTGEKKVKVGEFQLTLEPSLPAQFRAIQANANALAIPIGWVEKGTEQEEKYGQIYPRFNQAWDRFTQHILGWLLTALAATLGAPFWFDTLNRIIAIRSSGKAPEEKPKAPREVSTPVEPGQSHREADRLNHRGD